MKNSVFTLLSMVLLLFFSGVLVAQELDGIAEELGIESTDSLENVLIEPVSASTEQVAPLAPPNTNMLGGFMQFLFLVALTVTLLFGWQLYRKHRAEKIAEYNDW